ncbi:uncharacterized protein LOC143541175 [Bidens hawaiensis]|uniref:uncharacterized protein LOC143541175 n=1 Tax=Bidens hawaiensis TaxID=980011 RepID=UPI00404A92A7
MKVIEHQHPLKLIDLQVKNEDAEESDEEVEEEEKVAVAQNEFVCPCKRCNQPINEYYRYYYKCIDDSCDYSLHKFCAELPKILKHRSHSHLLTLIPNRSGWTCYNCLLITEMPFYKCGANENESCNFAPHEWCTLLPTEVHTTQVTHNIPSF